MADRCGPLLLKPGQLDGLLERVRARALEQTDYPLIEAVVQTLGLVRRALEQKKLSIERLRRMLFGAKTESTSIITATQKAALRRPEGKREGPPPGHGRRAAHSYWGARRIEVLHEQLHVGDVCPDCHTGKLYDLNKPAQLLSFTGAAPIQAELHACQRLRCSSCGVVFTAAAPEKVRAGKHDPSAASMIALLRYGSGFPFHRLQGLQETLGIPLAASVQWKLVHRKATLLLPLFGQLQREAAQGEVIYVDDTTVRILTVVQVRPLPDDPEEERLAEGERKGSVTTGLVSRTAKATIVLYRSGSHYAGENLKELLSQRDPQAGTPIQMSDGLNRNRAADVPVLRASCNAHSPPVSSSSMTSPKNAARSWRPSGTSTVPRVSAGQAVLIRSTDSSTTSVTALRSWRRSGPGRAIRSTASRWSPTQPWGKPFATCSTAGSS